MTKRSDNRSLTSDRRQSRSALLCCFLLLLTCFVELPMSTSFADTNSTRSHRVGTDARRRRAGARVRRRPRLTTAQRRQIQRWHAHPESRQVRAWLAQSPPPLVFFPIHGQTRWSLTPSNDEGDFEGEALLLAGQALVSRDGETHPIHPRLVALVYRAVRHFRAPYVHVISGYRPGRPSSRHAQGRAIDFVLPGVSDRRLAGFLRPQGFVGVGIYPVSGFVHLDVRGRSHFWSDSSGPNEPNRERPMLRSHAARYDAAARRLGVEPLSDVDLDAGEPDEVGDTG